MALFKKKSKEEKDAEKLEKLLEKNNLDNGLRCKIILPQKELKIESHSAGTKILSTVCFGLVGAAATSGSKSKKQNKEIETTFRIAEKGVVFERASENGTDIRISWDNIVNVNPIGKGLDKLYHFELILLKNQILKITILPITIDENGKQKLSFKYKNFILLGEYYISKIKCNGQDEEGW